MYLDWKTKANKVIAFDIETDNLIDNRLHIWPTKIWCAVFKNVATGERREFVNTGTSDAEIKHEIAGYLRDLVQDPDVVLVGHNCIPYDLRVLNHLCGLSLDFNRCIDTLVLSYLYNPHLPGGHSLEAYGTRLGIPKLPNDLWGSYNPVMLERCRNDVDCTIGVLGALTRRLQHFGYSELSCQIEHKIRHIIDLQEEYGFWFDTTRARDFYQFLRERESDLAKEVHSLFPPRLAEVARYKRRVRVDGSYYSSLEKSLSQYAQWEDAGEEIIAYNWKEFNIGSPQQRVERMTELGWRATKLTKGGRPQLDEESLLEYATSQQQPAVEAMAKWLVHNGRANMLETWLKAVSPVDSRMHGRVFSCGAQSRRMRHTDPNSANIPSSHKALYGKECRALWGVEPGNGYRQVGYDAAGLENAGLCHYLNNRKASEVLVRPKPNDIHTLNAQRLTEVLGRPVDREWGAKTSYYAWLYGAYPPKLGSIVGGGPEDGQAIIDTFFANVPGLKKLINNVQGEFKHNGGRLRTIDGGSVICPSANAALNYKIQSMGGIVMKMASIIIHEGSQKIGFDQHKVGDIHDEGQHEVLEAQAEEFGKFCVKSITEAGETLGMNVRLGGDYSVGQNWSETH